MKTADLNFEDYMNAGRCESQETQSSRQDNIFERLANPPVDFLTGSQLVEDDDALKASRAIIDERARRYGCTIAWEGTIGQVMKDGKLIEMTEIHGATWDREHREAFAVRADLTKAADLHAADGGS